MTNKMDEMIVVVPRVILFGDKDEKSFQGGLFEKGEGFAKSLIDSLGITTQIMRRGDMEEDPWFKQIIPYAFISTKEDEKKFFVYERLVGGDESRLHNKLSLGVGGHMNRLDNTKDILEEVKRELDEEVKFVTDLQNESVDLESFSYTFAGLINDDSDEVGKVHLGVVIDVEVDPTVNVAVRETDQLSGRYYTLEEVLLPENYNRLENWSKIVIDNVTKK